MRYYPADHRSVGTGLDTASLLTESSSSTDHAESESALFALLQATREVCWDRLEAVVKHLVMGWHNNNRKKRTFAKGSFLSV